MTKRQVAKLNAFFAVIVITEGASAVWTALVAFVSSYGLFTDKVSEIEATMQVQEQINSGYTADKAQKRGLMADLGMRVKGAVQAFASGVDQALYDSVNFSRSKITNCSSAKAETRAWIIYNAALPIVASLADYGLTPGDLSDYQKSIDNFHDVISMPKAQKDIVKTATSEIKTQMKEADAILHTKLNKLMENFRVSAPTFYSNFFNAERIDDAATSFTEIRALITNNNTGVPLEGVLMTATGGSKVYTNVSNLLGVADEKPVSPSIDYVVTFELDGFQPVSMNVSSLSPGELRKLVVKMMPV